MKIGDTITTTIHGDKCMANFVIDTRAIVRGFLNRQYVDVVWLREDLNGNIVMDKHGRPLAQMDGQYNKGHFKVVSNIMLKQHIIKHKFIG